MVRDFPEAVVVVRNRQAGKLDEVDSFAFRCELGPEE